MDRAPRRRIEATAPAPLLLLLLSLIAPFPTPAQQVSPNAGTFFRGVVMDAESGAPLATASVSLYGSDRRQLGTVFTDESGRYLLQAPVPGDYRLRAERVGYHPLERGPITLQANDTLTLDFHLTPAPLLLDSILVSVKRQGRALGPGEQLVYGRLLDNQSGEPIPQGLISLRLPQGPAAASTLSDNEGLFWLVSPQAATYRLQAERIGYKSSTGPELNLMPGDTIGIDFYLSVEAVLLNPIVVRGTARPWTNRYDLTGMEDFLRRYARFSRSGFGDFLIRDSIAKYESWAVSTGHMLSMTMMPVWTADPLSGRVEVGAGCNPRYYLNGFPWPPGSPVWAYTPNTLEAVEVYERPTIPAEFLMGFPCGVVAYWTRRAPDPRAEAIWWRKWVFSAGIVAAAFFVSAG